MGEPPLTHSPIFGGPIFQSDQTPKSDRSWRGPQSPGVTLPRLISSLHASWKGSHNLAWRNTHV